MATGLIATTVACIKPWQYDDITHKWQMPDSMVDYIDTTLYSKMEELLGIIAACMPCLKRPAEKVLCRIRVLKDVHWPGLSKPSFVFSTGERSVAVQSIWSGPGQMPLQDVGRLLHKESQGSELGLARTRSMEWYTGTTLESGNSGTNTRPTPSLRTEEV
jgi:hypothetical protein